jgi:hypothetical protein
MRRVLIIPAISTTSVASNFSFQELFEFSEIVSENKGVYWYIVVPPWVRDGMKGHKNLQYVHLETTRDIEVNDIVGYSAYEVATQFARRGGKYVVDAVITDCVEFSLQLQRVLSDLTKNPVPVFVRDLRRKYLHKKELCKFSVAQSLVQGFSGVTSRSHRSEVVSFLSESLKASVVNSFIDRSFVWPLSSNLDYLDKFKSVEKRDEMSVFLGGEPEDNGGAEVLGIYKNLFACVDVDVRIVTTSSMSRLKVVLRDGDYSYLGDMKAGVPVEAYYTEMAKSHLFVSVAESEKSFHDDLEKMVLGQVGIFPWKSNSFVANYFDSDYPFLYLPGDHDQALSMAQWVVDNYKDSVSMISKYVDKIRKLIDRKNVFVRVWSELEKVIFRQYRVYKMKEWNKLKRMPLFNAVNHVATQLGDQFAMRVFLDILEEQVTWLKPWNRKETLVTFGVNKEPLPTVFDLREMLSNLGWEDTCESPDIVLFKKHDVVKGVYDA